MSTTTAIRTKGYCVKCKEKREIENPEPKVMLNGKGSVQGHCPVCGTRMFRAEEAPRINGREERSAWEAEQRRLLAQRG